MADRNSPREFQHTAQNEPKIIGTCIYCKGPIYEGQEYRKIPLRKDKYVHKMCEKAMRAHALAVGAWLRT
jgi:hypothetical protein